MATKYKSTTYKGYKIEFVKQGKNIYAIAPKVFSSRPSSPHLTKAKALEHIKRDIDRLLWKYPKYR